MSRYILAFDQGTTSSRSIVFDENGHIISVAQKEFTQHYPHPGWVEHDPDEIWQSQMETAKDAIRKAGISPSEILAIGITNQRETTVVWNRLTGQPVCNAIVWQDRRTAGICQRLIEEGMEEHVRSATGLVVDAYFSGTKVHWILENIPGARASAEKGDLLFGTVDSWLLWKLTGGKVHATDFSNASRTLLFNINTLQWDAKMLEALNIPRAMLPEVKASSGVFGNSIQELLGAEIPIAGIAGDQQAALFGQVCHSPGMAKNTYGTGCFMLMNTGTQPVQSKNGLLTTIAWGIGDEVEYALEGSVFIAGAAIQWLRDGLGLIADAAETEALAKSVESTDGVYMVPAFAGMGAPYWDMYARGAIVGLTRGTTKAHLVRAALESIAFQSKDLLTAMEGDAGMELKVLKVDGGATANNFLMQFQADILGSKVERPKITETTALGAAYLAGMAVGLWSQKDLAEKWELEQAFLPAISLQERNQKYHWWQKAVQRSLNWIEESTT
ncbi:MAG: glycerol kinase [Saprospirales bacterium]|nr:glycerol kinase [Saprospirales bacterium]